ncbi:trimeric intracellular cation channel family protein [Gordonia alkaliphila]|uniref:Trimeric intracellular cation channel family protein n=1 Tax=Gordonia alkaliphila TaxID=1053547 RepID=A0ABP8ZD01_9ACTN|nr:trimeric intracellular cation channel family protein [Gordonia alkaliphila]
MNRLDDAVMLLHHSGELIGTIAFAASGALMAVRRNLDVVGILLLAVATALGGGILRDVTIGNTPPNAFTDMRYLIAAVVTGMVIFSWRVPARLTRWPLEITDAVGLGMFAVVGTVVAYQWGLSAPGAALLGLMTAVGGGVIRDMLSGQVPSVLRPGEHLYAIPALACAAVVAILLRYTDYQAWMGLACAVIAISVRLASLKFGWHGPRPWYADDLPDEAA